MFCARIAKNINPREKRRGMAQKYVQSVKNTKSLFSDSFEIQKLMREHQKLERELTMLNAKKYLTDNEQLQKKSLQKMKLHKKDLIAMMSKTQVNA